MTDTANHARRRIRESFRKFPKPQWAEWNGIPSASLWELVALAVDIEPSALTTWNTLNPAVVPPERFHSLLRQAKAAIADPQGVLAGTFTPVDDPALAVIPFGNFREWARTQSVHLPELFPIYPAVETEDRAKRKLRLTQEIADEKSKGTKGFMKAVADREGIAIARLQQIVGKKDDRAKTLAEYQKTNDRSHPRHTTR